MREALCTAEQLHYPIDQELIYTRGLCVELEALMDQLHKAMGAVAKDETVLEAALLNANNKHISASLLAPADALLKLWQAQRTYDMTRIHGCLAHARESGVPLAYLEESDILLQELTAKAHAHASGKLLQIQQAKSGLEQASEPPYDVGALKQAIREAKRVGVDTVLAKQRLTEMEKCVDMGERLEKAMRNQRRDDLQQEISATSNSGYDMGYAHYVPLIKAQAQLKQMDAAALVGMGFELRVSESGLDYMETDVGSALLSPDCCQA